MLSKFHRPFALAGLAASAIQAKAFRGATRGRALDKVATRLGRMHGLPQKIGQIIASAELDGDASRFSRLSAQSDAALPLVEAQAVIERELGAPLARIFSDLDPTGIAASIGQVHRSSFSIPEFRIRLPRMSVPSDG
jgi:predicted unusual protein kinase regulating ubiquinone biosynthesis (AarF/ABC1/UbiB family)